MPKREHKATMAQPTKDSKRSKRRASRGFQSLLKSSRKHRRAEDRLLRSRTIGQNHMGSNGTLLDVGLSVDPPLQGKQKTFHAHAGGAYNFH